MPLEIRLDKDYKFYTFDMNNRSNIRNYFDKLKEYQIHYKEWESIVKKVNLKESGLSELFIKSKDEIGLIEVWFLTAIEDKLNKGSNRIKEFNEILNNYIKQYKENKSKIEQKKTILFFKEETVPILDTAETLKSIISTKESYENIIANLIERLKELIDKAKLNKKQLEDEIAALNERIRRIKYEEISFKYYEFEDKKVLIEEDVRSLEETILRLNESIDNLTKQKNVQQCSKIYALYKDASLEVQEQENKLELVKEKDKDRTPEREKLGYTLRHYYENEVSKIQDSIKNLEKEINLKRLEINETIAKIDKSMIQKENIDWELATISSEIRAYNDIEAKFNKRYGENLTRNMLDEYQDFDLSIKLQDLKNTIEQKSLDLVRSKGIYQENNETIYVNKRQLEDLRNKEGILLSEIRLLEGNINEFEKELDERKIILKYIGLTEQKLFNTSEILQMFKEKKDEVLEIIKNFERDIDKEEKEYSKLASGRIFELPKAFKDVLELEGIHYTYGMDWIKKNNKSPEENRSIIENNSFIPYGIIMSSKNLEALNSKDISIHTSIPIPIIRREDLELEFEHKKNGIQLSPKVNFYVLFNDDLLDEVKLNRLLLEKEEGIDRLRELLSLKNMDFKAYDQRYNAINYQKVNERDYKDSLNNLVMKKKNLEKNKDELNNLRNRDEELTKAQGKLLNIINQLTSEAGILKQKLIDLEDLNNEYKNYKEQRLEKVSLEDRKLDINKQIKERNAYKDELVNYNFKAETRRIELSSELKEKFKKLQEYIIFEEQETDDRDIEDVEARYKAISSEIKTELRDIEEALNKARKSFDYYERELTNFSNKYNLSEEEYINESYDDFIFDNLEEEILSKEKDMDNLKEQKGKLNSKLAVIYNDINHTLKDLEESLGEIEPLPRTEIVLLDFKNRRDKESLKINKINLQLKSIDRRLDDCSINLSNLAEFTDLNIMDNIEFEVDIETISGDELNIFRGKLIRDYRQKKDEQESTSHLLGQILDKVSRKPELQDDFFRKPLNTLSSLVKDPIDFVEQLLTTIRAYDDLMAKLDIDIAIVEKEKEKLIEILLQYISDVHKNMGKIDKNSTIKIRDKSVKMLRINLPDWEDEELSYKNKLNNMVSEVTQSGLKRLEDNENIEELIGTVITTKNLYNSTVGINNISIKLYKIEAEREVPIVWADVAKNSGGEGFLSAFVVLSSLLSFMRRDETDIFGEYEEGKVLLMDNPFAQTNSSHLLKPLMEVARKSNTQLICFTGLGGESIYNRFDNIYVLNLISSSLRKGMQYLKSEHTKGEELETIVSSQIRTEDVEQLNLLF